MNAVVDAVVILSPCQRNDMSVKYVLSATGVCVLCAGVQGIPVAAADTPAWRTTARTQIFLTMTLVITTGTIQREYTCVLSFSRPHFEEIFADREHFNRL